MTPEDLAQPSELTIAEPPERGRLAEWELAQAARELAKREKDLAQAKDRKDRADAACADAQAKWMEAQKRLDELKEKAHG